MAAINDLTGQNNDYLTEKVGIAYTARFGKKLPKVSFVNPKEDPEVLGRVHFQVKQGSKVIGDAVYKPKRESVWVAWR